MPIRNFLAGVVNNLAQQNAARQQQYIANQNDTFQGTPQYNVQPYFAYPQQQFQQSSAMTPAFTWDTLIITPSNQATPLFSRLLDAIFNYFTNSPPVNPLGFDPIKYAATFTALMYSDNNNKVRRYFIFATENRFPSPEQFVYDVMPMYYRSNEIQYTMQGILPILTRQGFHTTMLRDTLGDPEVQWKRLNSFLAAHGNRVLDPATGRPFPSLTIPRAAFPASVDRGTWERQEEMNRAFNEELGKYLGGSSDSSHEATMAAIAALKA